MLLGSGETPKPEHGGHSLDSNTNAATQPTPHTVHLLLPHVCPRTFSVETKSAVSSRVNWLIWSTIVAILGFVGTAAASDCHLRCILCCAPPTAGRTPIAGRAVQTQRLKARETGADMLCCGYRAVDGLDGCRCVVLFLCNAPSRFGVLALDGRGPSHPCQKSSRKQT